MVPEEHVCEPPIGAACWQIKIYIGAEIQIHAGIIQKPTYKMATKDTV
jgi:hypothetical protein